MPVQVMVSRPPVVTRERVEQEPTDTATQPHTACVMQIHGSFCGTRRSECLTGAVLRELK